jgi:broad specificity phosphatase PhoE
VDNTITIPPTLRDFSQAKGLWLVRHALSESNVDPRHPTIHNRYVDLAEAGFTQAKDFANGLRDEEEPELLLYSPYLRAKQTMEAIKRRFKLVNTPDRVRWRVDRRLKEFNYLYVPWMSSEEERASLKEKFWKEANPDSIGNLEVLFNGEPSDWSEEAWAYFSTSPSLWYLEESWWQLLYRSHRFLRHVEKLPEKRIMAVSHEQFIQATRWVLNGQPWTSEGMRRFYKIMKTERIPNCGVLKVTFPNANVEKQW